MKETNPFQFRGKCYQCNRPKSSCMCSYVHTIDTKTQFIILMHPKEHQKTKNGTGYLTHLSLTNSKVFKGIDFSEHKEINEIIKNKNNQCYILYPGKESLNISQNDLPLNNKNLIIFIIDSTWACSRKILRKSRNLQHISQISFDNTELSEFKVKKQPKEYCLSTIESTKRVLELLKYQNKESIPKSDINLFLNPFKKMVEYQLKCAKKNNLRIK